MKTVLERNKNTEDVASEKDDALRERGKERERDSSYSVFCLGLYEEKKVIYEKDTKKININTE